MAAAVSFNILIQVSSGPDGLLVSKVNSSSLISSSQVPFLHQDLSFNPEVHLLVCLSWLMHHVQNERPVITFLKTSCAKVHELC